MKKRVSSLEKNKLLFYVVVAISFFNIIVFLNAKNWNSVIFFVLAGFVAYTFKVDKTISLVIALISANIFWASTKLQEGMETDKTKITAENTPSASSATTKEKPVATPPATSTVISTVTPSTVKPSDTPTTMGNKSTDTVTTLNSTDGTKVEKFANIDSHTLEGLTSTAHSLMDRQDQLHSLAKQLGPLMKQASKMMKQLPDGFLQEALKKKR